jgi:riboflavin kinase / FMN adenylyltransferase
MLLLRKLSELSTLKHPLVFAFGVFDGVHLGHQAVIRKAARLAREMDGDAVVLTFHPHPSKVLRPKSPPLLLTTEQQDHDLFSSLDADVCVTLEFNTELSQLSASDFLEQLRKNAPMLKAVVVGHDWHFGRGREGDFKLLKAWADQQKLQAIEVAPVKMNNEIISSTLIRSLVGAGNMVEVNQRLGRSYQIMGRVVRGKGIGTQLGFPTTNIEVENELIPAPGVYAARALIEGEVCAAAVNIGTRPTITDSSEITVEAFLIGFVGDLYGHHLRLDFLQRIRNEQKFESLEALIAQIKLDIQTTLHVAYS